MTVIADVAIHPAVRERLWGTFEAVKDHLFEQWRGAAPPFPETGLTPCELRDEVQAYLAAHADLPRVLQRAHAFRIVVARGQIGLDPADWFVFKLNHGGILRQLRDGWLEEAERGPLASVAAPCKEAKSGGAAHAGIDLGHISPGWVKMFSAGLTGLIAEARQRRQEWGARADAEQLAFYEAVEIVLQAAIALAGRYAGLAEEMIAEQPEHAGRLRCIVEACRQVPAHTPRGFYEALQFHFFMHELIEMEGELVRSAGHFDRLFYPYYQADLESGRLTREQAKELMKFFWMKWYARTRGRSNGKNFVFAGQDAWGQIIANDLTYAALEAYAELNAPDPKFSIRFLPQTPERLYRVVVGMIRQGHNSFVLMNDAVAVEALERRGKTPEDARLYLPIGCYEPAVDGKEAGCTMNIIVNLAKGVELALHDGLDPLTGRQLGPRTGDPRTLVTFEQFYQAYRAQMDAILVGATEHTKAYERQWPRINPSPLLAATIDDCLARGKDIGQGGAHYNSVGCVGLALANAADSLLAIKWAVYEDKRLTMAQLLDLLRDDFAGLEPLRQYLLNRIPKWGNGAAEADELARRVADDYCDRIHTFSNARGGAFQAALFSLTHRVEFGAATGALPDGRHARETLSAGVGAMTAADKNGATGLINSVTKLDFSKTPNGSVVDIMLHPSAVAGEDGLEAFVALCKTFFAGGGYAVQFNVLSLETLRAAQQHPERYANLQIRVTGWSVYWNALTREEQDHFIARNVHGL